ncbi:MAG: hypothetical protein ABI768_03485 [Acidobacteriota bacterium]
MEDAPLEPEPSELERLRLEASRLRDLVRKLSAQQAALLASLPADIALAHAKGVDASAEPAFRLENWDETIELTPSDVLSEMALLWQRLPPRGGS